jgi:hypothetical protein
MTGEVSEDYLIQEEGASEEAGTIEVDPETEAALTEAGIEIPGADPTPTEESEELQTEEAETEEAHPQEAAAEETEQPEPPAEEAEFQQPELVEIDGQLHRVEDVLKSRAEANAKIREQGQYLHEYSQIKGAWDQIARDPEGQKIIARLAFPQQAAPEQFAPPTSPEEFDQWAASTHQQNMELRQTVAQQQQAIYSIMAHLENQAVTSKYGDALTELQPYIEQASQMLGEHAQYRTREEIITIAKGLKYDADGAAATTQQQTEKERTELQERHREKVLDASVESANTATNVAPKIVDPSKMGAKELEKHLGTLGVKTVHHD